MKVHFECDTIDMTEKRYVRVSSPDTVLCVLQKVIEAFEQVYGKAKEYTILNGQKEGARWSIDDKEINIQSRTNDYCANGVEQHTIIVKLVKNNCSSIEK